MPAPARTPDTIADALRYYGDKLDLRKRLERTLSLDPQEGDLGDMAVDIAGGFIPGVSQALAVRDIERARRANDPAGMALASTGLIPGGKLADMLKKRGPVISELDVFHGSPHKFDEFDASKIGTGEGAQAYGHGIYLAESPEVARGYQNQLAYDPDKIKIGGRQIKEVYKQMENAAAQMHPAKAAAEYEKLDLIERLMQNNSIEETAKAAAELSPATQKWFEKQVKPQFETYGAFYKADLPDEMVDRMLDWDSSIKSQPENIRNALQPLLDKHGIARTADIGTLISAMGRDMPQSMVSEKLRELGIPGIKYLDAGSRGQGGAGTRNFVVFPGEEKNVSILERNGKKLASALKEVGPTKQNVEVNIYPMRNQPNMLYLSKIEVPEGQRGMGLGSQAMQNVINSADAEGKTIVLSPSTAYGATSVGRLKDFYKRFGFVENKGRNKNYAISESMYRVPQKQD